MVEVEKRANEIAQLNYIIYMSFINSNYFKTYSNQKKLKPKLHHIYSHRKHHNRISIYRERETRR